MLPHISRQIQQTVHSSSVPVLCLVVSEGCEHVAPLVQTQLEEELAEKKYNITYVQFCVAEDEMPFPRLVTPALYFFLPHNPDPVFYRTLMFQPTLHEDIMTTFKMMQGLTLDEARFSKEQMKDIHRIDAFLEKEKTELVTYPSSFQMARNLAAELWRNGKRAARGLPLLVDTETGFRRLSTCESCDRYDMEKSRCKECGCFMKTKTQLAASTCPLNKW